MADQTSKSISAIHPGDEVLATDPTTGTTSRRIVTAVSVHNDTLVDLETSAGTVVTTEDHPYWNATDRAWLQAQDLDPGDSLATTTGHPSPIVQGLNWATKHTATAFNLTVADIHTYYVMAGSVPVLVHNAGCLEGVTEHPVYNPVTREAITDIDLIEGGALWELKGGLPWHGDSGWMTRNILGKFEKYMEARQYLPAEYRNAAIGFRFTNPGIDSATRAVIQANVDALRAANPGVTILLEFAS